MPFKKGQSGNPKGRPKKARALTAILERAGATKVALGGAPITAKRLFAFKIWEGLTTGVMTFGEGAGQITLKLDGNEYITLARLVLGQIDGPPPAAVEVSGVAGSPIEVRQNHEYDPDSIGEILHILRQAGALEPGADEAGDAPTDELYPPQAE